MSHKSLLKALPGVRTLVFLPIKDLVSDKIIAGCFLWTASAGRMMSVNNDFAYLRAFGIGIASEVSRLNVEKLDKAKNTFIASMSHELRSPLHGILGSVEFLQDTAADSYQAGLITSIANCGRTLLDTLSNLLSYAKVSTLESANATMDVDLAVLVEEVVEAVCAGHAFKRMHSPRLASQLKDNLAQSMHSIARHNAGRLHSNDDNEVESSTDDIVCVLFDMSPSLSWNVNVNPGAVRRIVMNLVGNALKYTKRGFVAVSLRAKVKVDKLEAIFRVVDSGKGISQEFIDNHLFTPFKQEDTFASGTGLGLSIVKQLTESLGGTIQVESTVGRGTEIELSLMLPLGVEGVTYPDEEIRSIAAKTTNLRLCVLDPDGEKQKPERDHIRRLDATLSEVCSSWFGMEITSADKMPEANSDFFLYTEPPSLEYLMKHHGGKSNNQDTPLIIVCMNAEEAISISNQHSKVLAELGSIVEVIPQPCGPRKLAKVLDHCIQRREDMVGGTFDRKPSERQGDDEQLDLGSQEHLMSQNAKAKATPNSGDRPDWSSSRSFTEAKSGSDETPDKSDVSEKASALPEDVTDNPKQAQPRADTSTPFSKATALPEPPRPANASQRTESFSSVDASNHTPQASDSNDPDNSSLHILIVDDNKVNLDLLIKFVSKCNMTFEKAMNGQEAVDIFKSAIEKKKHFDYILMDISMPVMDGIEATKRIRRIEEENNGKHAGDTDDTAKTGVAGVAGDEEDMKRAKILALSAFANQETQDCLLYTSPSPRDGLLSRMPSSA